MAVVAALATMALSSTVAFAATPHELHLLHLAHLRHCASHPKDPNCTGVQSSSVASKSTGSTSTSLAPASTSTGSTSSGSGSNTNIGSSWGILPTRTTTAAGASVVANVWAATNGGSAPAYGINVHALRAYENDHAAQFRQFASIGTKWIRTDVTWDEIDPGENGQYNQSALTQLDQVVAAARSNNLNVLLVTLGGNANNAAGYGNLLKFFGNRYLEPASGPVVAYEIWNEANLNGVSASTYAALANAGCQGVKASASKTTSPVVWGAIANTGEWQTWTNQALGASTCLDAVSIHPYVVGNDVATLHQMMVNHGYANKPVWYTEFGPSTSDVSEQQQSNSVISTIDQAKKLFPYVTVAMQYEDRDEPSVSPTSEQHFGVFHADSSGKATTPKAVFAALRSYYAKVTTPTTNTVTPTLPPA